MEPNQEIDDLGEITASQSIEDTDSVDDFIRQLEAKEKDLHITASTTVIEFDDESAGDAEESPVSFELERNDAAVVTPVKAAPPETLTSGGSNNGRYRENVRRKARDPRSVSPSEQGF